ncbi:hypothetical protein RSOCI_03815 [Rhabdochlamydiaceae symbiont of Dictyostelium giganteum]
MSVSHYHMQGISTSTLDRSPLLIADQLTQRVKNLCQFWQQNHHVYSMQNSLENLYQEGLKLVRAEVQSRPLTNMVLTQVIITLTRDIDWKGIQNYYGIHYALSKVYRIFLELIWYRSFDTHNTLSIETKKNLLNHIGLILKEMPCSYSFIHFEYECAIQAIKTFPVSKSPNLAHFQPPISLWERLTSTSFSDLTSSIKNMMEKREMNQVSEWSLEVHSLRWNATLIQSSNDFEQILLPELHYFQSKGYQYTLGLAAIYIDLIQNQYTEDTVKIAAAKGLLELIQLTKSNVFDLKNIKVQTKQDRYASTRLFIKEYINYLMSFQDHSDLEKNGNLDQIEGTEEKITYRYIREFIENNHNFKNLIHPLE